jgi:hypothetical protein
MTKILRASLILAAVSLLFASGNMIRRNFADRDAVEPSGVIHDSDFLEARGYPAPVWIMDKPQGVRFAGVGPEGRLFVGHFAFNWAFYLCLLGVPVAVLWLIVRAGVWVWRHACGHSQRA